MIGAKLPFALADPAGLLSGQVWLENGKTIVFGLVGGYFGVEIAKWSMRVRVRTGDTLAVPVASAVAVGRWSCFVGGCCYGVPTRLPWGVDFRLPGDEPGTCRHPTQLSESAFHLTMACLLAWLQSRGLFRGQLVKL
jgi:phosphatidylglycerol:prolipoprotein diacylglycerol transferase